MASTLSSSTLSFFLWWAAEAVFDGVPVNPDDRPNFRHQVALVDKWERRLGNETAERWYAVCGGTLLTQQFVALTYQNKCSPPPQPTTHS